MDLEELVDTFEFLGDWDARYDFIADLGQRTPGLPPGQKTDQTLVHGCMSKVWIVGERAGGGGLTFRVDGEAPIVRGLAAMLATIYEGKTPQEVRDFDTDALFDELGLFEHLSPQRHVGMYAMVERIKDISRECETGEAV